MKALVFGVATQPYSPPPDAPPLQQNLATTPVALQDIPDARPLRPDWFVTRPLLTGICGSDSKQILMDFGDGDSDNAMSGLCSFPQVMGHEVVAEVTELGPEADGFDVGQRVVLNPWLSCEPRGISPRCPSCEAGDLSLCWSFSAGDISKGIHTGVSRDATGGYAELMPAHRTMLFPVPDTIDDEHAIFADPFAVSLHSITRHPPPAGGRALVWGAGSLGSCGVAILRALYPDVEAMAVARFDAQRKLAESLGATTVAPEPREELVEAVAAWSGGVLQPAVGLPMAFPGGIDVVYDTIGAAETLEVGARVLRARGTLVKLGMHGPARWEDTPVYFKEITFTGSNAFGFEEVDGVRQHGIQHYLDMVGSGRVDLTPMLTHTFRLDEWRDAFAALADQATSGAIKVAIDQR